MALTKVTFSMIDGAYANVLDYGADETGATDSTAAIQSALAAVNAAGGGSVVVPNGGKFLIDNDLIIPANVSLVGPHQFVGSPGNSSTAPYGDMGGALRLNSTKTITLSSNSSLSGLLIYRKGMTFPAANAALFAGTAITINGDDCAVDRCMILGFAKAIYSSNSQRPKIQDVCIDCSAGVEITLCYDIPRLNNVHCWPFATIAAPGATAPKNHRSGSAFYMHDNVDGPMLSNCFAYGYQNGFYFKNVSTISASNCFADNTTSYATSAGWLFEGNLNGFSSSGCSAWSCEDGVVINVNIGQVVSINGFTINKITANAIKIMQGHCNVLNNYSIDCDAFIYVDKTNSIVNIAYNTFGTLAVAPVVLNLQTNNVFIWANTNLDSNTNAPVDGKDVAVEINSADPLPIRNYGTVFKILGTTNFGRLVGGFKGRQVTLVFDGILTVFSSTGDPSYMRLANNANFTTSAGGTLTLVHTGAQWFEIGRSA